MNLLLDTHALIWWLAGDESLGILAREAIAEAGNTVAVSAASAMEISTKFRLGKLGQAELLARDFEGIVRSQGFAELPITFRHAGAAGAMNIAHKDPFDRLLIAQAQVEDMVLVSNERLFDNYAVRRLW